MPSGVNDIRIETSNVKGWCVFSRFFLTFIILHFFHSNARVQRPNFGLRTYFVLKLSVDRVTSDIKFKRTSMDAINFRLAKMFVLPILWMANLRHTNLTLKNVNCRGKKETF